jgi:hypothetical protein
VLALVVALAVLLSTVDPRLAEPLRLLADVRAVVQYTVGEPIGPMLASRAASSLVTIVVEPLDPRTPAAYTQLTRTITISEALAADDPRVVASALAHELQHSVAIDLALLGLLPGDCLTIESRGFATQAVVARALYGDELPRGTQLERGLGVIVRRYERLGVDGYRAWLAESPSYRETCAALVAAAQ